jgi:hypothetical protein
VTPTIIKNPTFSRGRFAKHAKFPKNMMASCVVDDRAVGARVFQPETGQEYNNLREKAALSITDGAR